MTRPRRYVGIVVGAVLVAALFSVAALKVLYFGMRQTPVGNVGGHKVVFCWTWNSLGCLISNDGREGYYRIYDQDGRKVFELFTDTYAFDIVLTGEKEVEFQLDTTRSVFWPPHE